MTLGEVRLDHPDVNAARLHTVPFRIIREEAEGIFDRPSQNLSAFSEWTDAFLEVGGMVREEVLALSAALAPVRRADGSSSISEDLAAASIANEVRSLLKRIDRNIQDFLNTRDEVVRQARGPRIAAEALEAFVRSANNFIGNVYDVGPHAGVNIQVSDRLHLRVISASDGSTFSPRSMRLATAFAGRRATVPLTPRGTRLVSHHTLAPLTSFTPEARQLIARFPTESVNVVPPRMDAFNEAFLQMATSGAATLSSRKRLRAPTSGKSFPLSQRTTAKRAKSDRLKATSRDLVFARSAKKDMKRAELEKPQEEKRPLTRSEERPISDDADPFRTTSSREAEIQPFDRSAVQEAAVDADSAAPDAAAEVGSADLVDAGGDAAAGGSEETEAADAVADVVFL